MVATTPALLGSRRLGTALVVFICVLGSLDVAPIASASGSLGSPLAAAPVFPLLAVAQVSELKDLVNVPSNRNLFGGLVGDASTHVVTIYLSPGQTSLARASSALSIVGTTSDPDIAAAPKEWSVTFAFADTTLAALDNVLHQVQTAQPWRTDVDPILVGYGIDPAGHRVDVLLSKITSQIAGEAQQLFGALVALEIMQRPADDSGPTGQQQVDSQPYYGGDQLEGICTAGFAAHNPSTNTRGMITAGHCFSQFGVAVTQGTGSVQTGVIGDLTIQSWGNNLPDSEFLDATSPFGSTVDAQVNTSVPQGQPSNHNRNKLGWHAPVHRWLVYW